MSVKKDKNFIQLEWIHMAKLLLALAIGYVIVAFNPDPHAGWLLVSVIVIMMPHTEISQQAKKAVSRILGTCLGVVLGLATVALGAHGVVSFFLFLLVALFFAFARMKGWFTEYAVVLGLVTYALVTTASTPGWLYGVTRGGEIIAGIIIALIVSSCIFPLRSQVTIRYLLLSNWSILKEYYELLIMQGSGRSDKSLMGLEKKFLMQQADLSESLLRRRENLGERVKYDIQIRRIQGALFHYVNILNRVVSDQKEQLNLLQEDWNQAIAALDDVLGAIEQGQLKPSDVQNYREKMNRFLVHQVPSVIENGSNIDPTKYSYDMLPLAMRNMLCLLERLLVAQKESEIFSE